MNEQSQNWYAANLADLCQRNSAWQRFAAQVDTTGYRLTTAADGHVYLRLERGGDFFEIDGPEPAQTAVSRWLPTIDAQPRLFLVFAAGLGYLLFDLVKSNPNSRFLVVEPDPAVFKKAMESFDLRPYFNHPHIEFLVGVAPRDLKASFLKYLRGNDHSDYLPRVHVVYHGGNLADQTQYYRDAGTSFHAAVNHFWDIIVADSVADSVLGLANAMVNLSRLDSCAAITPYQGAFKGKSGIIVSSGPSLNNKIAWLREIQDRAVIICADSALRILLENGIVPYGAVCQERHGLVPSLFQGFTIPKQVALFTTPIVDPRVWQSFTGSICCLFPALRLSYWLPELLPFFSQGTSCAHLAYQLLQYLGCGEIAAVGQDLAFDRYNGGTHVAGIADYASEDDARQEVLQVPDNQGGTIKSHRWWNHFRVMFGEMIHDSGMPLLNVIESDRGARIDGAVLTDPETYFARLKKRSPFVTFFDPAPGQAALRAHLPRFADELTARMTEFSAQAALFRERLTLVRCAKDVEDYHHHYEQALQSFERHNRVFYQHLIASTMKRFDAAARSIWTAAELTAQLPGLCEKLTHLLDEIARAFAGFDNKALRQDQSINQCEA